MTLTLTRTAAARPATPAARKTFTRRAAPHITKDTTLGELSRIQEAETAQICKTLDDRMANPVWLTPEEGRALLQKKYGITL